MMRMCTREDEVIRDRDENKMQLEERSLIKLTGSVHTEMCLLWPRRGLFCQKVGKF